MYTHENRVSNIEKEMRATPPVDPLGRWEKKEGMRKRTILVALSIYLDHCVWTFVWCLSVFTWQGRFPCCPPPSPLLWVQTRDWKAYPVDATHTHSIGWRGNWDRSWGCTRWIGRLKITSADRSRMEPLTLVLKLIVLVTKNTTMGSALK